MGHTLRCTNILQHAFHRLECNDVVLILGGFNNVLLEARGEFSRVAVEKQRKTIVSLTITLDTVVSTLADLLLQAIFLHYFMESLNGNISLCRHDARNSHREKLGGRNTGNGRSKRHVDSFRW